jgi:hypothetical protein
LPDRDITRTLNIGAKPLLERRMISERTKPQNKQQLIAAISKAHVRQFEVYEMDHDDDREKAKRKIASTLKGLNFTVIFIRT